MIGWIYAVVWVAIAIAVFEIILKVRSMKGRTKSPNLPKEQYVWNGKMFVDKKEDNERG
jgi:hypothetical protein